MKKKTTVALIQQHATHDLEENLIRGKENFAEAADNGADLIAFAELAFLPFFPQHRAIKDAGEYAETIPGELTDEFSSLAENYGVVTVLNTFERDGEKTFDSSPVIDAGGELLGATRMVHIMEGPGFHEKKYYHPGDSTNFVYDTAIGRVGVVICYDRHYPEYMRNLALEGAELVVVPQAGEKDEWTSGVFEAELQVASFQNGYFSALVNRVGEEEVDHFGGGSYVVDPDGQVVARADEEEDEILYAELDPQKIDNSHARRHFLEDRRPYFYSNFTIDDIL